MKKTTTAPLSKEDLDALVEHTTILDQFGVYDICSSPQWKSIQLTHERLVEAILASGVAPTVTATPNEFGGLSYSGEFHLQGVKFHGVLYASELPLIGYRAVDIQPVKIDKPA